MAQNQRARGAEPGPWHELSGSRSRALRSPPCPDSPGLPQGSQLASRDGEAAAQGLSSLCPPYKAALGETWPLSATEPEVGGSRGEQSQQLTAVQTRFWVPRPGPTQSHPCRGSRKAGTRVRAQGRTQPEPERSRDDQRVTRRVGDQGQGSGTRSLRNTDPNMPGRSRSDLWVLG